jgi:hypothetical protein
VPLRCAANDKKAHYATLQGMNRNPIPRFHIIGALT